MKKLVTVSILSFLIFSSFTTIQPDKPNGKKNEITNKKNSLYKLDKNQARKKISYLIRSKFGKIYTLLLSLWPFKSQYQKDKVNLRKKELREINAIAEQEIESPDNYKKVPCQESFVRYVKVKDEKVPVTDFRTIKRRKWHEGKLEAGIFGKIVILLSKRSYEYALKKTGNPVIADMVKRIISSELIDKIESNRESLAVYIGKDREIKVDGIINQIIDKENYTRNPPKQGALTQKQKKSFTMYPSNRCVRCLKSFRQVKRVYLYPCGHDMCQDCFKTYHTKCPICRKQIEQGVPEGQV